MLRLTSDAAGGAMTRWISDASGGAGDAPSLGEPQFAFADYRLYPERRMLLRGGVEIPLRGREFDLLVVLLENAGKFIGNDALIAHVWPTSTVSESNLRVQIASLRRALGDNGPTGRLIVNVTGRGYSFASPIMHHDDAPGQAPLPPPPPPPVAPPLARAARLPASLTSLVGRDSTLARLQIHLSHRRLMSIVGPGGIGKTSLSIALADRCAALFADGVFFIDFATVKDGAELGATLAKGLNLRLEAVNYAEAASDWLSDREVLLIFDNCEHVISDAAELAEMILHAAADVRIICTSREPLRVQGEWVHRLAPLDAPPPSDTMTIEEAMAYSAIELFVERAQACSDSFTLSNEDAGHISEICRKLDGIPLAIELAAARVDKLAVASLAKVLPQRLQILGPGKRTARPHQQTLRATLDWSYVLLAPRERVMLARLSIFRNAFTLDAALAVARDEGMCEFELTDSLFELIGKSLVAVEPSDEGDYYRLLETTRIYARERLEEAGEAMTIARRHAQFCLSLANAARAQWASEEGGNWIAAYDRWMDDISAALDWAYSAEADAINLGIELAALSAPLAGRLARLQRFLGHVSIALERTRKLNPPNPDLELEVSYELSYLLQHIKGDSKELRQLCDHNEALSAKFATEQGRLNTLFYQFGLRFSAADWAAVDAVSKDSLAVAHRLHVGENVTTSLRMRAQAHHYLARHADAIADARRVIDPASVMPPTYHLYTRVNPRVSSRVVLARSLWLTGAPEEAQQVIYDCLALADKYGNNTLCQALGMGAVAIAIWSGDTAAAISYCKAIGEVSQACGLHYWAQWGGNIEALLADQPHRVDVARGGPLMLDDLSTYHPRIVDAATLERARGGLIPWCASEVMRAYATNRHADGLIARASYEQALHGALMLAREQGALGWELRIACDQAELALANDTRVRVAPMLEPLVGCYANPAATADLRRAAALLAKAG